MGMKAAKVAAIGGIGGGAVQTYMGINKLKENRDEREAASAEAVRQKQLTDAQRIADSAKEAEALAEQEAKDAARKKLAKQTRTVYTSGLGVLGSKGNQTLGD